MRDRNLLIVDTEAGKHKIKVVVCSLYDEYLVYVAKRKLHMLCPPEGSYLCLSIAKMRTESWEGSSQTTVRRKPHSLLPLSSPAGYFLSFIICFFSRLPGS